MKISCLRISIMLGGLLMALGLSAEAWLGLSGEDQLKVSNSTTMSRPDGYIEIYIGQPDPNFAKVDFGDAQFLGIRAKKIRLDDGTVALRDFWVRVHVRKDPQALISLWTWKQMPGLYVPYREGVEVQSHLSELSNLICQSVGSNEAKELTFMPDHNGTTRRGVLGKLNKWESLVFTAQGRRLGHAGYYNITYETPGSFLSSYPGYEGVAILNHLTCQ